METQFQQNNQNGLELLPVGIQNNEFNTAPVLRRANIIGKKSPFIEANTFGIEMNHLKQDCIIPVFSKDNERTIAHQEFIEAVWSAAYKVFQTDITEPEIRVSHQVKGRIPSAIHKPAFELLEQEKTTYYERLAFILQIPSITQSMNGNELLLTIGGVRSYNLENLYSKKSYEKFKFFIGFQNTVCCNLCISTDGLQDEIKVLNSKDLVDKMVDIMNNYNYKSHFNVMRELTQSKLTERQFAQLVGKSRLYQYLPKEEKAEMPQFQFNDGQISSIARDYYEDKRFCRDETGDINLWNVYNLFTSANKSSYIDSFLGRNVNALEFVIDLSKAINGDRHHWFIN